MEQGRILVVGLAAWLSAAGCGGSTAEGGGTTPDGPDAIGTDNGGGGGGGGGGANEPVGQAHARGDERAATRVGSGGGVLEIGNGARVEIPPGAITSAVEVVLQRGPPTDAFNNREDERTAGPTFIVTPTLRSSNGSKFVVSVPMTSVPDGFEQTDVAIAYEMVSDEQRGLSEDRPGTQTRWEHGNAAVRSGRMTAELTELPGYRVQFVFSR